MPGRFASLPKRVGVALIAIPAILWITYLGGYWFCAFMTVVSSLSLYEFYRLAEFKGVFPQKAVGLFFGVAFNVAFVYDRLHFDLLRLFDAFGVSLSMFSLHQFVLFLALVFLVCTALVELFRRKGSPIQNAGATVLGVFFISLFLGTLIQTRELFPFGFPVGKFFIRAIADEAELAQINRWGGFTVMAVFATIWVCDTAAYFGGMTLGKHKLFERVSPNKTWEGAVFGFVFAILTMVAAQRMFLGYLSAGQAIVVGMIIGCFGQL
ncbi:MAG TPA: phosphatidate cytidylyltransferase, partial [Bacteroidota bacterium]